ncbi:MAG TPA: CsgG/HfaB family protein [Vicinamibacterales bacterium]|jgi:curli biogenesis system outer membrane secretion channel CsgG|nr:CsgG/HfaB family protein [Vicinamibacterales bacterium]
MTRPWRHSVMAVLLLLAASLRVEAQAKVKIAIWEFENHSDVNYWFSKDLGPAARNQIDTEFSENAMLSSKFSVVERDKLNLVLKEQGLGASGAVDPATAAKVGKILGVKYILIGGIDKFKIDNTKGAVGAFGVGGNLVQSSATINMRMIDTTTAERLVSVSADGEVKKGGGFLKGTSLSRDSEWGIASETIQKTSKALVAKFVGGGYLDRLSGALTTTQAEGKIIKVEGTKAYINLGASAGVKMGDKFTVFNVGEALIDPDTGKKLGADEKQTGSGTITEVQSEFAVMTLSGTGKAKDTIRKQ